MAPDDLRYAAAAVSDRGRMRSNNEDAFGYSVEHGVYVVCDGMGGAAGGEVASSLAVDEVLRVLSHPACAASLPQAAHQAVSAANHAVFSRAEQNPRLAGMGTTLVVLVTAGHRAWVLNVGDSRCYRLCAGTVEQITLDHSLVEEHVRAGRMTPTEALRSPLRNVITRAIGTQQAIAADCFELEPRPGDLFLLCSDGLTRELPDAEIYDILNDEGSLQERLVRLVDAANQVGGQDNITCILVQACA